MHTYVYVEPRDAKRLYDLFSDSSPSARKVSYREQSPFEEHFREVTSAYLPGLEMIMEVERGGRIFKLTYRNYLPEMPDAIVDLGITPVKVEIARFNNAPTRARAGYYANPSTGFAATVERIYPNQNGNNNYWGTKRQEPLYAQNIVVAGPTLEAVQKFNTNLATGAFNRFLVHAFE